MDLTPFTPLNAQPADLVMFDRRELSAILTVYGRMVALGEWRDYAIDATREAAVFSIFRRTAEHPLYRVEKRPRLRMRGRDLGLVLRAFDAKLLKVIAGGA